MNCCVVVAYLTFQRCWVIGEAVAKKRRMPSSKGFDYFIESSFVEMYNEACHDLYAKASEQGSNLPVRHQWSAASLTHTFSVQKAVNTYVRQRYVVCQLPVWQWFSF